MLVYGLGTTASFLFLVRPPGEGIEAVRIAGNLASVAEALAADDPSLFELILPEWVWDEVRAARRVYLLPHGPLHRLPFETLRVGEGRWVDEGPPIAYAPSASVLAMLRGRRGAAGGPALVAVGDPRFSEGAAAWPENGVLALEVMPGGQAEKIRLRPGDVLVGYGASEISDLDSLRAAMGSVPEGTTSVSLRFVREGEERTVEARPGKLGVLLAPEPPPVAGPALLARRHVSGVLRGGALEPLPGTRAEVEAIQAVFLAAREDAPVRTLLGDEATEENLFEAVAGTRFLHLATHGIVDETRSASLSALALTRPRVPVPGDDGFLTLADLLERWRGRLEGTDLVVLSACDSHRGRLERDEGMLALPLGFCFAGARAAIASLWKVDDEVTARLMVDLYRRLLRGDTPGPCEALHAARRALRQTHPDSRHWGAFVFVGAP
jgi:hypothetical protein